MKIQARISAKLKAQTGASITYALLLFLVCAVVSSVVITAGTAASGRMSQSVENDQRYFSVTNTAEFLQDLFDGVKVEIKKEAVDGGTPSLKDEYPKLTEKNGTVFKTAEIPGKYSLLILAAKIYTSLTEDSFPAEMNVTLGDEQIATVQAAFIPTSKNLIFGISSYDGEGTDIYTLYLVFHSDTEDKELSTTTTIDDETKNCITYETTMTWKLKSMSVDKPEEWRTT